MWRRAEVSGVREEVRRDERAARETASLKLSQLLSQSGQEDPRAGMRFGESIGVERLGRRRERSRRALEENPQGLNTLAASAKAPLFRY